MTQRRARGDQTREALIEATLARIDAGEEFTFRIDDVLEAANATNGSLYYHFGNRQGLVDAAHVTRIVDLVREDIDAVKAATSKAHDIDDFYRRLSRVLASNRTPTRARARLNRARLLGQLYVGRSHDDLATEQHELNRRWAKAIAKAQKRGFVTERHDPEALAILVQGLTLGRIFDDVDSGSVEEASWEALVSELLQRVLRPDTA